MTQQVKASKLLILSDSLKRDYPRLVAIAITPEGEPNIFEGMKYVEADLEGEVELYWFMGRRKVREARRAARLWRGFRQLLREAGRVDPRLRGEGEEGEEEEVKAEPVMKAVRISSDTSFMCSWVRRGKDWIVSCSRM